MQTERTRARAAAALSMLAAAGVITLLVAANPARPPLVSGVDSWWRDLVSDAQGWAEWISRVFYEGGRGVATVPLRLGVTAWLLLRRRKVEAAAWVAGWLLADALTWLLKPGVGRLRPDGSDMTSFPSGHAKSAAQIGVGLLLLLPRPWKLRAVVPVTLGIVGMAASRTVLDHHWLSDVVAGSLIGAGCALAAAVLVPRWVAAPASRGPDSGHEHSR